MSKIKKQKTRGRQALLEDEEKTERNIKIWIDKFFHKLTIWELTKKYECSTPTITRALKFVNQYFLKIPNKTLLRGAIFSIQEREKRLTKLLEKELAKEAPATRSVVELNRELREDGESRLKLENILKERYEIGIEMSGSTKEILSILAKQKK